MRVKWIGLIILIIIDLIAPAISKTTGATGHAVTITLVVLCVILIFADCWEDNREYIKTRLAPQRT